MLQASQVIEYFESMNISPPPHTNPGDFILDVAFHARRKDFQGTIDRDPEHFSFSPSSSGQKSSERSRRAPNHSIQDDNDEEIHNRENSIVMDEVRTFMRHVYEFNC